MIIKKLSLAVVLMLAASGLAFSQEDLNPTIIASMENMTYNPKLHKNTAGSVIGEVAVAVLAGQSSREMVGYENAVRAAVLQGLSRAYRVTAVEGLTEDDLEYPYTITVGGDITNMTTTTEFDGIQITGGYANNIDGRDTVKHRYVTRTYFRGQVALRLQVKDAHDERVVDSPSFNVMATDMAWIETPEGAMNKTLEVLARKVCAYFNGMFPLTGNIIEKAGEKNDRQKEVYVDLGAKHGISINDALLVYRPKSIGGKSAREEIARLKIKKVEGDEVSFCKVTSGGKALKAALDADETLVIETK